MEILPGELEMIAKAFFLAEKKEEHSTETHQVLNMLALAVNPTADLNPDQWSAVIEVCRRLHPKDRRIEFDILPVAGYINTCH
jgi:hypothetical protein